MTGWKRRWRIAVDNHLFYLSLARKGGNVELGEEPVGAAARSGKAYLIVVASDASDHTWRRAKSFVAGTNQQCVRLSCDKDQLGMAIGRTSLAIAAFTDVGLALSFLKAQPNPDGNAVAVLEEKLRKLKQRQQEAKAHRRNARMGKKK